MKEKANGSPSTVTNVDVTALTALNAAMNAHLSTRSDLALLVLTILWEATQSFWSAVVSGRMSLTLTASDRIGAM